MIEKDRALLARLRKFNQGLGMAVVELCSHQDGGELPAAGLRAIGEPMAQLAADILAHADERERLVVDADGQS